MFRLSMYITLFCIVINSIAVGQSKCRVLFFDEFNGNSFNWGITEDGGVSSSIEDGYYYLEGLKKRKAYLVLQHLEIDEE